METCDPADSVGKINKTGSKELLGNSDAGAPSASAPKHPPSVSAEEDVPEDFFDDFLKEDFMAGLDIIDEDNEETDMVSAPKEQKKDDASKKAAKKPEDNVKKKAEPKRPKKDSQTRRVNADSLDIRRDPEKTRLAIQKDKLRSVKDKEKRLITDIVQTGLVPPGMELEVDISKVCSLDKADKLKPRTSQEKVAEEGRKRKRSPTRRSSKERDVQKPEKTRARSPVRRRSPIYSGRKLGTFSNHFRGSSPFDGWSRGYSARRRKRSSSPRSPKYRRRSKSRSRGARRSRSREWSPFYQRKRRQISCSPTQRVRKEEKVSFLEELAAKLNETHGPQVPTYAAPSYPMHNLAPMVADPLRVPIASFFNPPAPGAQLAAVLQPPQYDPYDESFFIGNQPPANMFEENFPPKLPEEPAPGRPILAPMKEVLFTPKDVPKLFADRRIKLSDFLAITAKPAVSNTTSAKLQEKIKVIQRCQDAIKVLNERKFAGPLEVTRTSFQEESTETMSSPMLRKPLSQLPFITPGRDVKQKPFRECCGQLLSRVGVIKELPVDPVPLKERATVAELPPPPQPIFEAPSVNSLATQTDKEWSCRECVRRRRIQWANCGVQTGGPVQTFSVSTQVNEADFYSMIPKTQSLASLTPAQLLGKQAIEQSRSSRLNRIPSPPPAPFIRHQNSPYSGTSLFNQAMYSQFMNAKPPLNEDQFNGERGRSGFYKRF